jgi:hypothetical protein
MAAPSNICNMALSNIGVTSFIENLEDVKKEAKICKLFYEQVRDIVLCDFNWSFARARKVLSEIPYPSSIKEWAHAFQLPTDYLKARFINNGMRNLPADYVANVQQFNPCAGLPPSGLRPSFDIEGKILLTDQTTVELIYTKQVTSETDFTKQFIEAFAWRLAAQLVTPLRVKPQERVAAFNAYGDALNRAITSDENSKQADPVPDAEYIRARG